MNEFNESRAIRPLVIAPYSEREAALRAHREEELRDAIRDVRRRAGAAFADAFANHHKRKGK